MSELYHTSTIRNKGMIHYAVMSGGYTKILGWGWGYVRKKILMRIIYTQKAAPGLHKGENKIFKKIFVLH